MKNYVLRIAATAAIVLVTVGFAAAQYIQSEDPCAIYPHQAVNIPIQTATAKLVAGALGKQIYVCRVTVAQFAGATPGVTLSYGEVVAATPCATLTPGGVLLQFGANATTNSIGGAGQTTLLGPVPAAASTPVVDLCSLVNTATVTSGVIDYVQY